MPIERDYADEMIRRQPKNALPRTLVALEHIFGRSARYDNWKCGFAYPLLLSGEREGHRFRYVTVVADYRGAIEMPMHRLCEEPTGPTCGCHEPFEDELSRADVAKLTRCFLFGLYEKSFDSRVCARARSFVREIPAQLGVYGKTNEEYFEFRFEEEEAYNAFVASVREAQQSDQRARIEELLASIDS